MKKNKVGNIILPDFRQCYKYTVIKTVWCLHTYTYKDTQTHRHTHTHTQRQMGCWNEVESQEIKLHIHICCPKFLQSCLTLCNSMDYIPPGSSVHRIFQAKILEWIAMPSVYPGIEPVFLMLPALASRFFLPLLPSGKPYSQLIFDKEVKNMQWSKTVSSESGVGKVGQLNVSMKLEYSLIPYSVINTKWFTELNMTQHHKTLRREPKQNILWHKS